MNILMMTNTYLPVVGGLERSIENFSRQFQKMGHKVLIVVPQLDGVSYDKNVLTLPSLFKFHTRDLTLGLPMAGALSKVADSFRPDVIHAHYPFWIGEAALRLSLKYEKPLIYTQHILFEEYGHYLPVPVPMANRFLAELSAGYANLASQVIAPSQSIKDLLVKEGVKTPVTVVPSGIDGAFFTAGSGLEFRKKWKIPQNAFLTGYAGRLAEEKNLNFLTDAVLSLLKSYPEAYFLAAGGGPQEEALKKKFEAAGCGRQVRFTGILPKKELLRGYHALDVFVFASKSETQGLVLAEAMAAGVPVTAVDGPGVREIVRDLKNGRLLKTEDAEAFKKALVSFMSRTPAEMKRIKRCAEQTAHEFSIERCSAKALKVYQAAIRDAKRRKRQDEKKWRKPVRQFLGELKILANFGRATGKALAARP